MSVPTRVPGLAGALDWLPSTLLSADEREALCGGEVDPYTWACALGRLMRSWASDADTCRRVRAMCEGFSDLHVLRLLRIRCGQRLDALTAAMRQVLGGEGSKGQAAWALLGVRDDLESVARTMGIITRAFARRSLDQAAKDSRLLEAGFVAELLEVDAWVRSSEDALAEALATESGQIDRQRIASVTDDITDGYWVALANPPRPAPEVLAPFSDEAVEKTMRSLSETRASLPWRLSEKMLDLAGFLGVEGFARFPRFAPLLQLPHGITAYAPAATAASEDELLEALSHAPEQRPLVTFKDGVEVHVHAPHLPEGAAPGLTLGGLVVRHETFDRIREVAVLSSGEPLATNPVRRVEGCGWWVSFAPFADREGFTLVVKTDSAEHQVDVDLRG